MNERKVEKGMTKVARLQPLSFNCNRYNLEVPLQADLCFGGELFIASAGEGKKAGNFSALKIGSSLSMVRGI